MLTTLIESIINGFLLGGIYAVIAFGMSLTFGIMRIMNIAHGEIVLFGSYTAFILLTAFKIDPLISLAFLAPLAYIMGFFLEKFIIGKALEQGHGAAILSTLGISIILENIYLALWTPDLKGLITDYAFATYRILNLSIPFTYILNFIASLIVMVILREFLRRTYLGLAIRAACEDWEHTQILGINSGHIRSAAFGISVAIGSISGVLVGLIYPFSPDSGKGYLAIATGVTVFGGLGSILGTLIGGIAIGLAQNLSATFLNPNWQMFIVYLIFVVLIMVKGGGLLGAD